MNRYLTEFIGTFFWVLTIGLAGSHGDRFAPIAGGAMLIALTFLGMKSSGAHYNPGVSLALFIQQKLSAKDLGLYALAQLLAAFMAAGLVLVLSLDDSYVFEFRPGRGDFPFQALIIEMLLSFVLVLTYLVTAQSKATEGNEFYGLAIGMVYMAILFIGGPISGGAYHLGIGGAANVLAMRFDLIWIYTLGPLAGSVMAGYAMRLYP